MSIALRSNGGGGGDAIRRSSYIHGGVPCVSIYDSSEPKVFAEDRRRLERETDSCSSSSIGRNSELSGGSSECEDSADDEVQSSFKGPLDTMDALEEVLPIKKGISKFYSGKSKSFTSLADVSSATSIKDLAKPENPYNKKRKNILARASLRDKTNNYPFKSPGGPGGTSKRVANCNRSTFVLCETLSSHSTNRNHEDTSSISTSPSGNLPPLHPHGKRSPTIEPSLPPRQSSWRSFSLSDLQSVASSTTNINSLAISTGDKNDDLH